MYRFLGVESYALFPRRADISPALIILTHDVAWAARYPTWVEEVYIFGNPEYVVFPEGTLSKGEAKFKQILDVRGKKERGPGGFSDCPVWEFPL